MDLTTIRVAAGDMRSRISLLQGSETSDDSGDLGAATVFASRWAEVRTLSGQELYRSQQFTSEANRVAILRYLPGVDATMKLLLDGRSMKILYVDDVEERHIKHVLFLKEVT